MNVCAIGDTSLTTGMADVVAGSDGCPRRRLQRGRPRPPPRPARKRRGGGRSARLARRTAPSPRAVPAVITRKVPPYNLLEEDSLQRLETHAEWILREID